MRKPGGDPAARSSRLRFYCIAFRSLSLRNIHSAKLRLRMKSRLKYAQSNATLSGFHTPLRMTLGVSVAPTVRPDLRRKNFSRTCIKLPPLVENMSVPNKGQQSDKGETFMWENFKESEFGKKLIKVFSNRGVIITTVLVVMVLTIAITATVATNRARKQNAELGGKLPTDTTQQTQNTPDTDAGGSAEETVPVYNEGNGTEQVIEKVEGFALPVVGTLGAKHDASVQVWSPTIAVPPPISTTGLLPAICKRFIRQSAIK